MIEFGADFNHMIPHMNLNMPLYAIVRGKGNLLDIMLENGASMEYTVNNTQVDQEIIKKDDSINLVHLKH